MHARFRAAALVLSVALVVTSCSSDSDGGSKKTDKDTKQTTTTVKGAKAVPPTWEEAVEDPCRLLPKAEVAQALPKAKVAATSPVARICTYDLGDYRTAGVELYFPQTDRSYESHIVGQPNLKGEEIRPILASPGSAVFVRKGSALALVTVRSSVTPDPDALTQMPKLAKIVERLLPEGPKPATKGLDGRDLCDVVPSTTFAKSGMTSLDLQAPQGCGYRLPDQTTISFQFTAGGGSAMNDGKPWAAGGTGALWGSLAHQGEVPVEGGLIRISTASPVRNDTKLQELAAKVVAPLRAAAGD